MVAAGLGGHPDLLQRFLQVDDDLALVCKGERDHGSDALVVDIGVAFVVHPVAMCLHRFEQGFGLVQIVEVGHYNFTMLNAKQILVSAIVLVSCVLNLTACGQTGPLYLPLPPAAAVAK